MVHQLCLGAYKGHALDCQMSVMVIIFEFGVVHMKLTLLWRRPSMSSWMENFWKHWQEQLAIYGASRIWFGKWIVPALHLWQLGGSQREIFWNGGKWTRWGCCYTSLQRNQPVYHVASCQHNSSFGGVHRQSIYSNARDENSCMQAETVTELNEGSQLSKPNWLIRRIDTVLQSISEA